MGFELVVSLTDDLSEALWLSLQLRYCLTADQVMTEFQGTEFQSTQQLERLNQLQDDFGVCSDTPNILSSSLCKDWAGQLLWMYSCSDFRSSFVSMTYDALARNLSRVIGLHSRNCYHRFSLLHILK
jgi:hypothetical protein